MYAIEYLDTDTAGHCWFRGGESYASSAEAERAIRDKIALGGQSARRAYRVVTNRLTAPTHPGLVSLVARLKAEGVSVAFWPGSDAVEAVVVNHGEIVAAAPAGPIRTGPLLGRPIGYVVHALVVGDLQAAARERAQQRERTEAEERARVERDRAAAEERAAAQERERVERERLAAAERAAGQQRQRVERERLAARERAAAEERARVARERLAAEERAAVRERERAAAREREREARAREHAAVLERERAAAQAHAATEEQARAVKQERERVAARERAALEAQRAAEAERAALERERKAEQARAAEREREHKAEQARAQRRERGQGQRIDALERKLNAALARGTSPAPNKPPPSTLAAAPAARAPVPPQGTAVEERAPPPPSSAPTSTALASPANGEPEVTALAKLLRCGAWSGGVKASDLLTADGLPAAAHAALLDLNLALDVGARRSGVHQTLQNKLNGEQPGSGSVSPESDHVTEGNEPNRSLLRDLTLDLGLET